MTAVTTTAPTHSILHNFTHIEVIIGFLTLYNNTILTFYGITILIAFSFLIKDVLQSYRSIPALADGIVGLPGLGVAIDGLRCGEACISVGVAALELEDACLGADFGIEGLAHAPLRVEEVEHVLDVHAEL